MSTNGETADLMVREGIQITESAVNSRSSSKEHSSSCPRLQTPSSAMQ